MLSLSCIWLLWPHGLQHARPSFSSPSPRVCPSSCPLKRWHHPTVSSSAALFSFWFQSLPASGSFPMSWLFDQKINGNSWIIFVISSVQSLSCVWPWTAARQASLSITSSWSLLKLMSIKSVIPSNHLILCHLLLLLPSIFPSIRVFSNESVLCIRWSKYWSFSFSISPSNEYSGLISFRIDLFDPLAVQGMRKSLLQHHNSKTSVLWCSVFFMVHLSYPYMTTR